VAYPYLALINNLSQAWAMYCLILFYKALRDELAPLSPFYKFLTVKAVVFLSFWQGQALLLATKLDLIDSLRGRVEGSGDGTTNDATGGNNATGGPWSDYDDASFATALQEFAICVEMFFAAIAHAYAFPVHEYDGGSRSSQPGHQGRTLKDNLRDMFDLRDVWHDVVNFSESNKDEFWGEVSFRYRRVVGVFTGTTPLKGEYSRVRDEPSGTGGGGVDSTNRGVRRFGEGGGTVGELSGIGRHSQSERPSPWVRSSPLAGREMGRVTNGRDRPTGPGPPARVLSTDMGVETALFATGKSFRAAPSHALSSNQDRYTNKNNVRFEERHQFSMPGVSALPTTTGSSFSVAPLEREGRSGTPNPFTLE
jgi:hypothetical protein